MVNKKIVAGLLIVLAILAVVIVASTKNQTTAPIMTPNAKEPPVEQPTSEQTTVQTLILSDDINSVTCQLPPAGNQYGGISGTEDNPPRGTVIDPGLTKQYGRPTATGVCGTYWYIVGWWFNASEMTNLPSETLLYGVSPYAITSGSDGGSKTGEGNAEDINDGNGDNDDGGPIVPVPEVATILLVTFGIFMFVALRKVRK